MGFYTLFVGLQVIFLKKNFAPYLSPKKYEYLICKGGGGGGYNDASQEIRTKDQKIYILQEDRPVFAHLPIQRCVITATPIFGFLKVLDCKR
ncbi:MAG: hypothetical protein ABI045_04710 [Flavobacteriales bacterium]